MKRSRLTTWLVALGLIVIAFAGTVITLNLTVFTAQGFTSSYLAALARHDVTGAMATAGVSLPTSGSRALLRADALGGLADIRLTADSVGDDGSHLLTYSYSAAGTPGSTTFTVERDGVNLGLFSAWRFSTSPATLLSITPQHAEAFTVNGVDLDPPGGGNRATSYIVLAPSGWVVSHTSTYLSAPKKTVLVSRPGSISKAAIDVQADRTFVADVQKELTAYLKKCVTQQVLLPTGCPMGQQIADRVQNAPVWTMVADPKVTIVPGTVPGSWVMPATAGTAHLVVTVKSIFDGSVSTFDKDVPFSVSYDITIRADNTLLITGKF